MKMSKLFALALLAGSAFAAPALAQDPTMMKDGQAMTMMPSGEMTMMNMTDKAMMDMAMKKGTEVTEGTIFMMSGGKLYMMQDMKMEDGRMMSEGMMMKQ